MPAPPTPEAQLIALRALAAELPVATSEAALIERALSILSTMLPGRALCVRVLDIRNRDPAHVYVRGGAARDSVAGEDLTIGEQALSRAKLKGAVAASA